MASNQTKIDELNARINALLLKQDEFSKEIAELKKAVSQIEDDQEIEPEIVGAIQIEETQEERVAEEVVESEDSPKEEAKWEEKSYLVEDQGQAEPPIQEKEIKSDLEKFIGENLINKIGVIITVIGAGIGGKYAIDHQLISPLSRIILGYLLGFGMMAFAFRLKKNYENFSAALLSGSMAINYFITFFAYDLYDLIPQLGAFALMVVFTLFTVIAALNYNRQLIAHIGLVGAYAVPFLLSDGSGRVAILLSYISIINAGILFISIKRYWRELFYVAFGLSWVIYLMWFNTDFNMDEHLGLSILFASIFFITFYATVISYRLLKEEKFELSQILILLINAFFFYGVVYAVLEQDEYGKELLGAFTVLNALIHFSVAYLFFKRKSADRSIFYLIIGLVLLFITIAIPIQLEGNWITLSWAGEALILYWIAVRNDIPFYKKLAFPVLFLAFVSQAVDWKSMYNGLSGSEDEWQYPIFNLSFLSTILVVAAFGWITHLHYKTLSETENKAKAKVNKLVNYGLPIIFLISVYYTFRLEVASYWQQHFLASEVSVLNEQYGYSNQEFNYDLKEFKKIWIINYSLLFVSLLSYLNLKRLKNLQLTKLNVVLLLLGILSFLIQGLFAFSELRESYVASPGSELYERGSLNVLIRYISLPFLAAAIYSLYAYLKAGIRKENYNRLFDLFLHLNIVWVLSSELLNIMDIMDSSQQYKLGLSLLWGSYCLWLIIYGIWKAKKHIRLSAIVFFGLTLIKLFFYDIAHLNTISKTIVMVSLGVLLLIISFLYNKFKHKINNEKS